VWRRRQPRAPAPRLFTVGRLDVASTGLLFVTNDGAAQCLLILADTQRMGLHQLLFFIKDDAANSLLMLRASEGRGGALLLHGPQGLLRACDVRLPA